MSYNIRTLNLLKDVCVAFRLLWPTIFCQLRFEQFGQSSRCHYAHTTCTYFVRAAAECTKSKKYVKSCLISASHGNSFHCRVSDLLHSSEPPRNQLSKDSRLNGSRMLRALRRSFWRKSSCVILTCYNLDSGSTLHYRRCLKAPVGWRVACLRCSASQRTGRKVFSRTGRRQSRRGPT